MGKRPYGEHHRIAWPPSRFYLWNRGVWDTVYRSEIDVLKFCISKEVLRNVPKYSLGFGTSIRYEPIHTIWGFSDNHLSVHMLDTWSTRRVISGSRLGIIFRVTGYISCWIVRNTLVRNRALWWPPFGGVLTKSGFWVFGRYRDIRISYRWTHISLHSLVSSCCLQHTPVVCTTTAVICTNR